MLLEKLTIADLQDLTAEYLATGNIYLIDGDWQGGVSIPSDKSGHYEQTKSPRLFEMARKVAYTIKGGR